MFYLFVLEILVPLLLIFIIVPLAELAVLIKVGSSIGILWTFGLIFLTAIIGVNLLRAQGLATLMRASERMQQGSLPAQELAEGFLLALAGALLLTPGFLTDACGFALLLPALRGRMAVSVMKMLKPRVVMPGNDSPFGHQNSPFDEKSTSHSGGNVIDGDYRREE